MAGVASDPTPIRVLHVHTSSAVLDRTAQALDEYDPGIDVTSVVAPGSALDRIDEDAVDCFLTPRQLPTENGDAWLDQLRERTPDLPRIVFDEPDDGDTVEGPDDGGTTPERRGLGGESSVNVVVRTGADNQYRVLANRIRSLIAGERPATAREPGDRLLDHLDEGVTLCTADGRIVDANRRVASLLDVDRDRIRGTEFDDLVWSVTTADPPDLASLAPGETWEETFEIDEDHYEPTRVDVTVTPVELGEIRYYAVAWADATDRERYKRDTQIHDAIFERVPEHIYVKDHEGRHVRVSEAFDDREEMIGKTDLEVYDSPNAQQYYEDDMRVIEAGEHVFNRLEHNPTMDTYLIASKVPWRDTDGEIQGLVGITRDVTTEKLHYRHLQEQNERLRRMANVISHDVRNPLQVAIGKIALLESTCDHESIETASAAVDEMNALLEDIMEMVRYGRWVEETEPTSIESTIRTCWEKRARPQDFFEIGTDLDVLCDPDAFETLICHLVENAVLHTGEETMVRAGRVPYGVAFFFESDSPGIPESERDHIFEAGYTTRDDRTGFGLTIVKAIAEAHGWTVDLTESKSGGARFEFVGIEWAE